MFQHSLNVVSTLNGREVSGCWLLSRHSRHYSTTQFERDLTEGTAGETAGRSRVQQDVRGLSGRNVFSSAMLGKFETFDRNLLQL